jgi:hypothetical protein|tara:strand:- start:199 stop:1188 length:990 start_codon:yes stop_codon:yes gene_type:complete
MNKVSKAIRKASLVGVVALLSFFGFNYYENFSNSSDLNQFLEEASTVSLVHSESSKEFEKVLNFDEINRDDFESTLAALVRDSQEAFNLVQNIGGDFNSSEKELLNIATSSWLNGLETFQVSIITLIDNPESLKIEEALAQSIVDLSIGDKAYEEFVQKISQRSREDNLFLPIFYPVKYTGLEGSAFNFADLIVKKARDSSEGLFLRRDVAITGVQFFPSPIAVTEDNYRVFLKEPIGIQVVVANEGNIEEFDIILLVLVTDEFGDSVFEKRTKISSVGAFESKSYFTDTIELEPGTLYEWFIKIEEIENEEELEDNLFTIFGFIPPEE